jgi:hypothetical protein
VSNKQNARVEVKIWLPVPVAAQLEVVAFASNISLSDLLGRLASASAGILHEEDHRERDSLYDPTNLAF